MNDRYIITRREKTQLGFPDLWEDLKFMHAGTIPEAVEHLREAQKRYGHDNVRLVLETRIILDGPKS